jgi:hypothetical protein
MAHDMLSYKQVAKIAKVVKIVFVWFRCRRIWAFFWAHHRCDAIFRSRSYAGSCVRINCPNMDHTTPNTTSSFHSCRGLARVQRTQHIVLAWCPRWCEHSCHTPRQQAAGRWGRPPLSTSCMVVFVSTFVSGGG